jgi:hypothetical protein
MQKLIHSEIEKTIDLKKLRQLVPSYVLVKTYDSVRAKTLKEALGDGKYTVLILLFNIHTKAHRTLNVPGHFFVISTRGPEPAVVFSSTGLTPRKELFITNSNPTLLDDILPAGYVVNSMKLQGNDSSNTCWRHAICFCHLAPMGLKNYQKLFSRPAVHLGTADELVTAFTMLSLY